MAKQGTSGADQAHQRLLLDELSQIGRNEKSIKPSALRSYPRLLKCAEVKRHSRPSATEIEPAEIASQALEQAIANLPTNLDRLIGQAIMGATDDFEGRNVDVRKRILDERYGCSPDTYKRKRPKVLSAIAQYLEQVTAGSIQTSANEPLITEHKTLLKAIDNFIVDVMSFQYSLKTYRIVCMLERKLDETKQAAPPRHHSAAIAKAIYKTYLNLILSSGYCFDHRPYSQWNKMQAYVSKEILTDISSSLDRAFDVMPFDPVTRVRICEFHFGPCDLLDHRQFTDRVCRAHFRIWVSLCLDFGEIGADSSLYRVVQTVEARIDSVVTACQNIVQKLSDYLEVDLLNRNIVKLERRTMKEKATQLAHDYYGLGLRAPILNGHSLVEVMTYLIDMDTTTNTTDTPFDYAKPYGIDILNIPGILGSSTS